MNTNGKEVEVSVCVICYNQEAYIEIALQSIIDQQTNFCFEIIVSDDGSTDRTPQIISRFKQKYPDKIFPLLHRKNFGVPTKNYLAAHNAAKGKYIAHFDGDDIMLPGKLQKQYDFLEKNTNFSVVWHKVYKFKDSQVHIVLDASQYLGSKKFDAYNLADIVKLGCIACHSSTMYRSSTRRTTETEVDIYDWMFYLEYLTGGSGAVLDEYLGAYRSNQDAKTLSGKSKSIRTRSLMARHLTLVYKRYPGFRKEVFLHTLLLLLVALKNKNLFVFPEVKLVVLAFVIVSPREFALYYKAVKQLLAENMKLLNDP